MPVSLEKEEDDDPFKLIQKGNAFEAASDHWRSAEFYTRASISLRRRADDLSAQIRSSNNADDTKANVEEKKKVVSLYRAQSLEYMYKARHCLMQALQFENDQDRNNTLSVAKSGVGSLDPLYSMISNEEGRKRRLIFETLFAGSIDSDNDGDVEESVVQKVDNADNEVLIQEEQSTNYDPVASAAINSNTISSAQQATESSTSTNPPPISDANGIDVRQQSIEARLAQLDTSLLPNVPPPFISGSRTSNGGDENKNRLNEIQKGLKGLGISLPDNGKKDLISDNLSAEDQIKLIIQQAKDEARFEKGVHDNDESNNDDDIIDENDSMFEGYIDEDYDIDTLLLKAEKLVSGIDSSAKDGKEESSSLELVQITKVQALLLEARLCLEMVNNVKSFEKTLMENNLEKHVTDEQGKGECEDAKHEDEQPISTRNDSETLAARKKARVLIQSAQDCLNDLLTHWKWQQ